MGDQFESYGVAICVITLSGAKLLFDNSLANFSFPVSIQRHWERRVEFASVQGEVPLAGSFPEGIANLILHFLWD